MTFVEPAIAAIVIFTTICWASQKALADGFLPNLTGLNSSQLDEDPIMELNERYYTFHDMTGVNLSTYMQDVQAEASLLSNLQLTQYINQFWNVSPSLHHYLVPAKTSRTELVRRYCELAFGLVSKLLVWV